MKDPHWTLCQSCDESHITRVRNGRETVHCSAISPYPIRIDQPVTECNKYVAIGALTKHWAEQIGWVLEIKKGEVVGFRPPKKER